MEKKNNKSEETKTNIQINETAAAENSKSTISKVTSEIEEMQKKLDAELKKLEAKKAAAEKREKFLRTKVDLNELRDVLKKTKEFEVDHCKLTLSKLATAGYNAEFKGMFSITNREILEKFCGWLDQQIEEKLNELEAELLK